MTRVLIVGKGSPDRGGLATFLEQILASDLSRQHDLRFLNVAHGGTSEGGRASFGNLRRTISDVVAVWRASGDRDVVHIHTALAPTVTSVRAGLLAGAGRLRGCRVMVHVHGGRTEQWLVGRRRSWLVRAALAPAHDVVAVSASGQAVLGAGLAGREIQLVENAVDLERFDGAHETGTVPRVLFAGVLTPRKGVLDLLAAAQTLQERGVSHELWLAGGTPDEGPDAERAVREAVAATDARLLGVVAQEAMPELYRSVDVFCLPSWWEAMPLTVLEAMAAGLPVVATSVGDVSRVVEHGVTGVVVPPRRPDLLADALEELLEDPARRARMGRAGRQRVAEHHAFDGIVARLDALYERTGVGSS